LISSENLKLVDCDITLRMNSTLIQTLIISVILSLSFCAIGYCNLQAASAQNVTESNFISYHSPDQGFAMQYPSNWKLDESSVSDGIVRFKTLDAFLPIFIVSIKEIEQYLDTDTLTLKNTTLLQSVQEKQNFYSQLSSRTGLEYKLIRQTATTVGGNDGIKFEYILGNNYWFEVFTIVNGKLYTLSYNDSPQNVPKTVKLANKAVESFQITS
jgi:PsbP